MKLDGETGSPFMVPHQRMPFDTTPLQPDPKFSWTLDQIPLDRLILRDTVILDIRAPEQTRLRVTRWTRRSRTPISEKETRC